MTTCQILIVDQEDQWRRHIGETLREQGHAVKLCASAEEGLEAFEDSVFDIVLSAVELPDIDGLEMIGRMRLKDPSVVAIIMSRRADQEIAVRVFEEGVKAFLKKPFDMPLLEAKLADALRHRREAVEMRLLLGDLLHTRTDLQHLLSEQNRQLTRTERYLYQLLDAAPFGIISTDSEGTILTYNGMARQIYGYTGEQVIGQAIEQFSPGEAPLATVGHQTHRRKNGDTIPVIVHHRQIEDEQGHCIAELYVVEDRSERQKLEQQLLHAERLSLLGQLAPRIAHEF
jgi:PAS domain S-box-containing protein